MTNEQQDLGQEATNYLETDRLFSPSQRRASKRAIDDSHDDNTHFHDLPVFEPKLMSREARRDG